MNRKYETLKFVCDKQYSNSITTTDDFEIRRIIIKEYEDELHVCFSWRKFFEWAAYLFIIVSLLIFVSKTFFVLSILCFIFSKVLINKYRVILRYYNMSVAVIDLEIYKKYNIVPPQTE